MSDFFTSKKEKKSKKSTTFVLKNIDPVNIDKKYQLIDTINSLNVNNVIVTQNSQNETKITSLEKLGISSLQYEPLVTVLPKEKTRLQLYPVMFFNGNSLPEFTDIPCFGCRRIYKSSPIGIPIKYTIDKINNKEYFDVDGMVCSFNCIKLHISESPSPLYKDTPLLINKLYHVIFGEYPKENIIISPSWRQRKEYGGNLTDEDFEKCLQTVLITDMHQIMNKDVYKLVSRIYEIEDVKNFL